MEIGAVSELEVSIDDLEEVQGGCHEPPGCGCCGGCGHCGNCLGSGAFGPHGPVGSLGLNPTFPGGTLGVPGMPGGGFQGTLAVLPNGSLAIVPTTTPGAVPGGSFSTSPGQSSLGASPNDWNLALRGLIATAHPPVGGIGVPGVPGVPVTAGSPPGGAIGTTPLYPGLPNGGVSTTYNVVTYQPSGLAGFGTGPLF